MRNINQQLPCFTQEPFPADILFRSIAHACFLLLIRAGVFIKSRCGIAMRP